MVTDSQAQPRPTSRVEQLRQSKFVAKIARYAVGSVLALATSVVVFALMLMLGVGTTLDSIVAFIAGAIPNWILNRRWAWKMEGRVELTREVVGYTIVSVISLAAASYATGYAHHWVFKHHTTHGLHTIIVTGAYVLVQAVLFVIKFVIYDRWVFAGRSRFRAALRSRHQVWSAARANRTP